MGVPKFFRWISERYPTISQLIAENRIPEFDNLYLDMNGIIHNCTHSDSDSPTHRVKEEDMFIAIFNYIEHLYGKIKPQKLFFMAIDGVAPRAKMNQQRARRFRTALDAERARERAIREGVEMPQEDAFDSNCITPGTAFMARLTQQLKYFVSKKVSEDADWQGVEIVLSGHEVPGEGEHKIMEYIRLAKAQPDYDPNVRHCLYGLDADLIMLGLLSHDPHFCLLREEVTFGRQSKQKSKELEHQNFYLMHLSVVREYLEHEFQDLREPGVLSFPFDMERIIDDFILLAFFVGNDFLPNLPNLHINEGALGLQFRTYKKILPQAKGYINEHGVINLSRLKLLLDELSEAERQFFESENADANYLKGKQKNQLAAAEKAKKKGRMVVSPSEMSLYRKIRKWVENKVKKGKTGPEVFDVPVATPAKDRKFVEELADALRLKAERVENENGELHLQLSMYPKPDGDAESDEDDEEGLAAISRVFRQYDRAEIVDVSLEDHEEELKRKYEQKFLEWKDQYYKSKFGFGLDNDEEMRNLAENYVEGLQWVLYYYYRGVASWPWFYRYHYSPRISDIHKGLNANLNFKLGQPFKPFEQLMGVLPDRSKKIVPEAYHELMTSSNSPIIDFYPRDFELDMNGKKMEWEAVVKIPFIQEDRLLAAMKTREHFLTKEERQRNTFGVSLKFTYSPTEDSLYESPIPGIFPDIVHNKCVMNIYELPTLENLDIIVGLCEGVKLGAEALAGFPSLKALKYTAMLGFHGITVFQQESRNESMLITLENAYAGGKVEEAKNMIGKRVYIGYPFLQEAKVTAISDEMFRYSKGQNQEIIPVPHGPQELTQFRRKAERMENQYSKRMGIIIGPVEVIVHVDMLKGMRRTDEGAMVKEYEAIPGVETDYAAQTIVHEVFSEDQRFIEREAVPIEEEFPAGTRAFFLGEYAYGRPLQILEPREGDRADVWVATLAEKEPTFGTKIVEEAERTTQYTPSFVVARKLGLNPLVLSKITSGFSVMVDEQRINLGLNLKFEAKKLKVLGYTRRSDSGWEFSNKAIALIEEYMKAFPAFFAGIMRNPQGDLYSATDFFDPKESKAKIKEIQEWLKKMEAKSFEKVPLEANQLDADVVKSIEQATDAYKATAGAAAKPKRVNGVPRKALLKPEDAEHRLDNQYFTLGDRVTYAAATGKVPIGCRGTIVGLTRTARHTLLDVIFDDSFMSGTTLGNRCSPFRGMTVPASTVLNLTNRQLVATTRAAPAPPSQPKGLHPDNLKNAPNYRNAPPPPALTGSYSQAANGTRGGRGGRGGGRGGPQHVAGNAVHPQQQHQQHQQPPNGPSPARGGFAPRGHTVLSHRGGPITLLQRGGRGGPQLLQQVRQNHQNHQNQPHQNQPHPNQPHQTQNHQNQNHQNENKQSRNQQPANPTPQPTPPPVQQRQTPPVQPKQRQPLGPSGTDNGFKPRPGRGGRGRGRGGRGGAQTGHQQLQQQPQQKPQAPPS